MPAEPPAGTAAPAAVCVGDGRLSLDDVVAVARDGRAVADLSPEVRRRIESAADWVARTVADIQRPRDDGRPPPAYYGINTGFGAQAGRAALDSGFAIRLLGRNLIASHSVGVGPWFEPPVVRAALLIRAQSLAQGRSGVRPLVVETLLRMLNAGVYPAVPEQGSLGASGDLAPLAHLVLTLSAPPRPAAGQPPPDPTDGEAFVPCPAGAAGDGARLHVTEDPRSGAQTLWRQVPGQVAMQAAGGKIELEAKEALALTNGATFSAALATLVLADAQRLIEHAALAVALTLEGIRGFRDPFFAPLHQARGHAAAERFGQSVLRHLEGSGLVDVGDLATDPQRVPPQDPYCVRCAPQVCGTIVDTLDLARRWLDMEVNAATDNPLVFVELPRAYKAMSGGNFHGEPIAMAMDFLAIALTELASLSERRMFMLTDYHPDKTHLDAERRIPGHGLSGFLIDEPPGTTGLNSGLMMLQATAAALVSDCKTLAHPASVDSIPSSGNQEDHVSMSMNAARQARDIVRNAETVLALEFVCAAQAVWLQRAKTGNGALALGRGTGAAYERLRAEGILPLERDRVLYPDIRRALRLVRDDSLLRAAAAA